MRLRLLILIATVATSFAAAYLAGSATRPEPARAGASTAIELPEAPAIPRFEARAGLPRLVTSRRGTRQRRRGMSTPAHEPRREGRDDTRREAAGSGGARREAAPQGAPPRSQGGPGPGRTPTHPGGSDRGESSPRRHAPAPRPRTPVPNAVPRTPPPVDQQPPPQEDLPPEDEAPPEEDPPPEDEAPPQE